MDKAEQERSSSQIPASEQDLGGNLAEKKAVAELQNDSLRNPKPRHMASITKYLTFRMRLARSKPSFRSMDETRNSRTSSISSLNAMRDRGMSASPLSWGHRATTHCSASEQTYKGACASQTLKINSESVLVW